MNIEFAVGEPSASNKEFRITKLRLLRWGLTKKGNSGRGRNMFFTPGMSLCELYAVARFLLCAVLRSAPVGMVFGDVDNRQNPALPQGIGRRPPSQLHWPTF